MTGQGGLPFAPLPQDAALTGDPLPRPLPFHAEDRRQGRTGHPDPATRRDRATALHIPHRRCAIPARRAVRTCRYRSRPYPARNVLPPRAIAPLGNRRQGMTERRKPAEARLIPLSVRPHALDCNSMSRFSRSMAAPKDRAWPQRSEHEPSARAPLALAARARRDARPLACLPAPTSLQGACPAILSTLPVGPSPSRGRTPLPLRVRPSPSASAHADPEHAEATGATREAQRDRSARQTTGRGARPRDRAA